MFPHPLLNCVQGVACSDDLTNIGAEQRETKNESGQIPIDLNSCAFPAALAPLRHQENDDAHSTNYVRSV